MRRAALSTFSMVAPSETARGLPESTSGSRWSVSPKRRMRSRSLTISAKSFLSAGCPDFRSAARHLEQQRIRAPDEAGGILERTAFGEQGLVEQQVRPVVEALAALLALQALDQRVRRIDLEDGLAERHLLPGGL